ncbi:hypothetical protein K491DRAFT_687382 [Lophiostoma macrostomum CBS 122681]|uniref:BTB domain-containing protein n=1 Tax=Lophiostoma macrostomum CBS 122681 TaxID=1314788 RepID=A0A6A6TP76_9PLEO|nr:hypothetical protein K491DRAFT_687382 [Lophiostoma macrostomum CBS 122681]
MVDTTVYSFGFGPPAKRKRYTLDGPEPTMSAIKDTRITQAQALRLNCPTITLLVGPPPTAEAFYIHEHAICDRSPFIASAMKPEWATLRPDPRTIELPEDDPAAFSLYMTWLYSGKLPILPTSASSSTSTSTSTTIPALTDSLDPDAAEGHHTLAYAYILGERLLDASFKNAISDAYVLYARGSPPARRMYPSNEDIRIIYEGTSESAPIRKLLVDIWTCRGKHEWIEADPDLPREFLVEVTKGLLKVRTSVENLSRPWKTAHEQYHEKGS